MSRLSFYIISAVVCSFVVIGHGDSITTVKPVTIDLQTDDGKTPPSTIPVPTTTVAPTTVTVPTTTPTTTSTTPSTTTSTIPSTTTSTTPSTTTSTTPSTTTPEPTTTPPPTTPAPVPPKPTPAPGPLPPPEQGSWSWTEKNVTCIMVEFAAQFNITYSKMVNNVTSLGHIFLNIPSKASASNGSCDPTTQFLTISWPADSDVNATAPNTLTLNFSRNDTTKLYALSSLKAKIVPELFVNSSFKDAVEFSHAEEWRVPLSSSYRCLAASSLNMTEAKNAVATLTLSRLQEEAFRTESSKAFSAARDCPTGDVPDAVPIAVGCALAGLVLVVLLAYLYGRRRSAARGYLSM